jgi:HlyD family secretion protein
MKRWLLAIIPLVLLGGLIFWRLSEKRAEAAREKAAGERMRSAPANVETARVSRRDIVKTFEAIGNVEAPVAVDVTPKVTGRILFLGVREGDRVQAGQVLVRVDPAEVQAEVRQKQAAVAQARSRLAEAAATANAQGVDVASTVAQRQAALQTAQAQNRQAQADFAAQIAAAEAAVTDAEARITATEADIGRSDAAIARAEASVANAQAEVARQEALVREGASAQQVLDNARTELQVQRAALGQAQQERRAAVATRASAQAQKRAAERRAQIARNKARADVAAATAGVAQARATLRSARANTAQTSAYAQNLRALEAAVAAAEADLRATEARLADTTLRAPISGVVTRRALDNGALASPGQPILSVQAVQQVWATMSIPEEVSRRIYAGQPATVSFDALPGEPFAGRVEQVLPAADPQSRQFTARVRLDNRRNRIRPGMFGRVTLVTEKATGALVRRWRRSRPTRRSPAPRA